MGTGAPRLLVMLSGPGLPEALALLPDAWLKAELRPPILEPAVLLPPKPPAAFGLKSSSSSLLELSRFF